jgi:hypothetical protein
VCEIQGMEYVYEMQDSTLKTRSKKCFIFLRENVQIRDHSCLRIPEDFRESCKGNYLVIHNKVDYHQAEELKVIRFL